MNEYIQQILTVLTELTDDHRQLNEYGKAKTKAITTNQIDSLSYIASKEKKVLERITQLEQQRAFLVGKYMLSQNITGQNRSFRMEKLIQVVYQAEEKTALQKCWLELSDVLKELKDTNDFNQQLIRMNLEYLHFTQDLLLGPVEDDVTYHRALKGNAYSRTGKVNTKF